MRHNRNTRKYFEFVKKQLRCGFLKVYEKTASFVKREFIPNLSRTAKLHYSKLAVKSTELIARIMK